MFSEKNPNESRLLFRELMCVFTRGGTEGRRGRPTSPSRRLSPPRRSVRLPFPVIFWRVQFRGKSNRQWGRQALSREGQLGCLTHVPRLARGSLWARTTLGQLRFAIDPILPHPAPRSASPAAQPSAHTREPRIIIHLPGELLLEFYLFAHVTQVPILRHPSLSPPTHAPPCSLYLCPPHTC